VKEQVRRKWRNVCQNEVYEETSDRNFGKCRPIKTDIMVGYCNATSTAFVIMSVPVVTTVSCRAIIYGRCIAADC